MLVQTFTNNKFQGTAHAFALRSTYDLHVPEECAGTKVDQRNTLLHSSDLSLELLVSLKADSEPVDDLATSSFLAVMLQYIRSSADPLLVKEVTHEETEEDFVRLRVLMDSPSADSQSHLAVPITLEKICMSFSISSADTTGSQSMEVDGMTSTPLSSLLVQFPLARPIKEILFASLETFFRNLSVKFPLIFNRAWATNAAAAKQYYPARATSIMKILDHCETLSTKKLRRQAYKILADRHVAAERRNSQMKRQRRSSASPVPHVPDHQEGGPDEPDQKMVRAAVTSHLEILGLRGIKPKRVTLSAKARAKVQQSDAESGNNANETLHDANGDAEDDMYLV